MSEQKLEVYNVLNFLNRGNEIEDVLKNDQFGTFSSAEECIQYLVDEGYLEGDVQVSANVEITAETISKKYIVSELKDILRENGLKVSGKKSELVERVLPLLKEAKDASNLNVAVNKENSYDNLELTDKAKDFLKENDWIDLYNFALVAFRFEDYETYVESSNVDKIETALNFCDEILSRSLVANHFLVFLDALYAQTYATYDVINEANILNLRRVVEALDMGNLKKRFDRIWNLSNIHSITVPKKSCFKILKKALAGADIEELNFDLKEKYFNKKFGI